MILGVYFPFKFYTYQQEIFMKYYYLVQMVMIFISNTMKLFNYHLTGEIINGKF